MGTELFSLNILNPLLNFCVGVLVGGHIPTNFSYESKDAEENLWPPSDAEKRYERKTVEKWILRGLKLTGLT